MGNTIAWQREMLQFWSLVLSNGRRLKTPPWMFVRDDITRKNRPRNVRELARMLSERIQDQAHHMPDEVLASLEDWLANAVIVPGEKKRGVPGVPAAGLSVPHFVALPTFARGVTRERYWATTFWLWLASDQQHTAYTGRPGVASALRDFLSGGLEIEPLKSATAPDALQWQYDLGRLERKDPEILLTAHALAKDVNDGLPGFERGLPPGLFAAATAVLDPSKDKFSTLCPGTVIQLRRSMALLLQHADSVGHGAMAHLLETALVHHAAQYYVRGMRVLNDLVRLRRLPDDCGVCWDRFAADLDPLGSSAQRDRRWAAGEYRGQGSAENARFVDVECKTPQGLFLNAGAKEDLSAKDLARMSLDSLRQQLGEYTVNRLWMSIAWDVANELASQVPGLPMPATIADVLPLLDQAYKKPSATLLAASVWRNRLALLLDDKDAPPDTVTEVLAIVQRRDSKPLDLEDATRRLISETVLSARYFGRYQEVLNSLLGGGALPSNQDPKSMIQRGGDQRQRFHLAINDSLLELLVAVFSCEADEAGEPLSFTGFLDRLSERYRLDLDRVSPSLPAGTGLAADAISQSRQALRARMSAMGFLTEFSDSANWNRVSWGR